jgi:hypothetical protein
MMADRATAHAKGALKMLNLFHRYPQQIVEQVNGVKNLEALFLDRNCPKPPFLSVGKTFSTNTVLQKPPDWIHKQLVDSDDNESWLFDMNIINAQTA